MCNETILEALYTFKFVVFFFCFFAKIAGKSGKIIFRDASNKNSFKTRQKNVNHKYFYYVRRHVIETKLRNTLFLYGLFRFTEQFCLRDTKWHVFIYGPICVYVCIYMYVFIYVCICTVEAKLISPLVKSD